MMEQHIIGPYGGQATRAAWGRAFAFLLLVGVLALPAHAQGTAGTSASPAHIAAATKSVEEEIAAGDRESSARRVAAALAHYEAALAVDARHHGALWRAARASVDLGEVEGSAARRVALYRQAVAHGRRAIAAKPDDAHGHFQLARALGRTALSVGVRDRVKYAADIRTHALRALEIDPRHAGALHIMGVWNAEIMRLNGMARMVARTFLGGQVFSTASWAEATRYLEQAVASAPGRMVHRIDLARVYRDTGRAAEARAAYETAIRMPVIDPNDDAYRRAAEAELRALR